MNDLPGHHEGHRPPPKPIRVGISSCLLGAQVRFDGGHKRDRFLADVLGPFVEWVPACPEVEAGFGTPREAMRMVADDQRLRVITTRTGVDVTSELELASAAIVQRLSSQHISGYVLKSGSPSCGRDRVKVYESQSAPSRRGRGLFAAMLCARVPHLPVEEEGRLADPRLCENFIERVFAYQRLQELFAGRWTVGTLVAFHTAHKLTLMAHSVTSYQALGRLVAQAKAVRRAELRDRYVDGFMTALENIATPSRHTNALQHLAGHLKTVLDRDGKAELGAVIEDYRRGLVPLVVPMTLLRHYVRLHRLGYIARQTYLDPHPRELALRNHV